MPLARLPISKYILLCRLPPDFFYRMKTEIPKRPPEIYHEQLSNGQPSFVNRKVQEAEMYYSQPSSNFPIVVFVTALLIGMGLLIYHSLDITQENQQLKQSLAAAQVELSTLDTQAKALQEEVATCTLANNALNDEKLGLQTQLDQVAGQNTILTNEASRLQGELDQVRNDYTALQASVNGLDLTMVEELRQENENLNIALNQCTSLQANQPMLQSSFLPTDLATWTLLVVIGLVGVSVLIFRAVQVRRKKASVLHRLYEEQSLSRI